MPGGPGLARSCQIAHRLLLRAPLAAACAFWLLTGSLVDPRLRSRAAQTEEAALRASLGTAGDELIRILEKGRSEDLLRHISPRGLTVGIDALPTDLAVLRKQFAERRLSYCLFFDTDCYRKESAAARKRAGAPPYDRPVFSLKDTLKQHPQKERLITNLMAHGKVWLGNVSIVLDPGLRPDRFSPFNVIELGFDYEAGGWKLAGLEFAAM